MQIICFTAPDALTTGEALPGEFANICTRCEENITEEQMKAVRPMHASSEHRAWHYSWHSVRGTLRYDARMHVNSKQRLKLREACPFSIRERQENEKLVEEVSDIPADTNF